LLEDTSSLRYALGKWLTFTQDEWDKFRIRNLRFHHSINTGRHQSGALYFVPSELNELSTLEDCLHFDPSVEYHKAHDPEHKARQLAPLESLSVGGHLEFAANDGKLAAVVAKGFMDGTKEGNWPSAPSNPAWSFHASHGARSIIMTTGRAC